MRGRRRLETGARTCASRRMEDSCSGRIEVAAEDVRSHRVRGVGRVLAVCGSVLLRWSAIDQNVRRHRMFAHARELSGGVLKSASGG